MVSSLVRERVLQAASASPVSSPPDFQKASVLSLVIHDEDAVVASALALPALRLALVAPCFPASTFLTSIARPFAVRQWNMSLVVVVTERRRAGTSLPEAVSIAALRRHGDGRLPSPASLRTLCSLASNPSRLRHCRLESYHARQELISLLLYVYVPELLKLGFDTAD